MRNISVYCFTVNCLSSRVFSQREEFWALFILNCVLVNTFIDHFVGEKSEGTWLLALGTDGNNGSIKGLDKEGITFSLR